MRIAAEVLPGLGLLAACMTIRSLAVSVRRLEKEVLRLVPASHRHEHHSVTADPASDIQ